MRFAGRAPIRRLSAGGEIGEGLVDDEGGFRMPEGELPEGGGRDQSPVGLFGRPRKTISSPRRGASICREVRDEAPLLPEGKRLHGQTGQSAAAA